MKRWFSASEARLNFLSGALILGLFLLPFLPNLAGFGFYKDDWHMIWAGHTLGPQAIISLFVVDRPFMGVVNAFTYALLGDSPLAWTVFALALRAAGSLAFGWLISLAWPKLGRSSAWAVLFFLIYPGFLQQPNAATFQNHFITLALAILSIALSLKAVHSGRSAAGWLLTLAALISGGAYLLIYEYMIGLEATRLAFLALQVSHQAGTLRERARRLVQVWLPYAGLLAAFLVWRVLIFKSARSVTNVGSLAAKYTGDPLGMGANLLLGFIKDFFEAVVSGWFVPLYQLTSKAPVRVFLPALLIGLAGAGLAWAAARGLLAQRPGEERSGWSKEAVFIGLLSIAGGILPVIAADRNIFFESQFDRYTLHLTLGIALLLVGLGYLFLAPAPRVRAVCPAGGCLFDDPIRQRRVLEGVLAGPAPALVAAFLARARPQGEHPPRGEPPLAVRAGRELRGVGPGQLDLPFRQPAALPRRRAAQPRDAALLARPAFHAAHRAQGGDGAGLQAGARALHPGRRRLPASRR